jgi:C1A family cysteine protease
MTCSSCFAFSALAAVEGAVSKKYGKMTKLSEQAIIDCNTNPVTGNWGCNGGWMGAVFEYIIGNNGTEPAKSYPYEQFQMSCRFNASHATGFLKSYGYIIGNEEVLEQALFLLGPLALGVNARTEKFFDYGMGIFDDPECNSQINHGVTLVGYGIDRTFSPPKPYWIIRNSWGISWGENGYMRMIRGKNMCGITKYVVFPVVV